MIMSLKGEALSMIAYGKEGQRNTTDIDILTKRGNVPLKARFFIGRIEYDLSRPFVKFLLPFLYINSVY